MRRESKQILLKIDPDQLWRIMLRLKRHEVRECNDTDRDFQVGDTLFLTGYYREEKENTGGWALCVVTDITHGGTYGLPPNLCVMTIDLLRSSDDK